MCCPHVWQSTITHVNSAPDRRTPAPSIHAPRPPPLAQDPRTLRNQYLVVVSTANIADAGTDANVYIDLVGGCSPLTLLPPPPTTRPQGAALQLLHTGHLCPV